MHKRARAPLAEVMVDAIDLVLAEHREFPNELHARRRVTPKRLLEDEALDGAQAAAGERVEVERARGRIGCVAAGGSEWVGAGDCARGWQCGDGGGVVLERAEGAADAGVQKGRHGHVVHAHLSK